ncbi:unnamed protein product [Staurois parvus]|uniref:Uncharacterized protein n=1 Tax=Staurois parvus TaxID=386267 RepID=A0ABN9B1S9_9NEOB|nr:unnamed protein product [Staurois parvus]
MQSGKYYSPGNRQIQTHPSDCQRSVIHHSREHIYTAVQWLHGLVNAVLSCFHFVIIPLTVDCGIFSSKEISRMDLLHRWQPITVPRLSSLSS